MHGMQEVTSSILVSSTTPKWRNGRRGGLKNRCPQRHVGSTPSFGIVFFGLIMMKKILFRFFLIVAAANLALCAHAQSVKTVTLKDGSAFKIEDRRIIDIELKIDAPFSTEIGRASCRERV